MLLFVILISVSVSAQPLCSYHTCFQILQGSQRTLFGGLQICTSAGAKNLSHMASETRLHERTLSTHRTLLRYEQLWTQAGGKVLVVHWPRSFCIHLGRAFLFFHWSLSSLLPAHILHWTVTVKALDLESQVLAQTLTHQKAELHSVSLSVSFLS